MTIRETITHNSPIAIELLPGTSVTIDGAKIDRFPNRRLAALLGYLALHEGWQARERIAEAIWPNLPEHRATASLRNALSALRRVLDPQGSAEDRPIETTRTHARLRRSRCECDAWQFERANARGDTDRAVSLYRGELLDELTDEWLEIHREEFRSAFHAALDAEARKALASDDPARAAALAERWRTSDPFEPAAAERLALALAAVGRKGAAKRALARFEAEVQTAFGEPSGLDLTALERRIDRAEPHPPAAVEVASEESGPRLPIYLSRYFGRERELAEIASWAESPARLLTLLGMGGIGKTRLAIEATGSEWVRSLDLRFVSLSGADSRDAAIAAIVRAFELRETEGTTPEKTIARHLASLRRPLVLILDNLEQIVEPAAEIVLELLEASPWPKILCTSRERLGIEGEKLLRLEPLEASTDDTALRMFVDRARGARGDFAITGRNRTEIEALCQDLEGLPLAIELVAAWAGTWTVPEMRARVADRQIVGRRRGGTPRHRSLEACLSWSYELVEPEDREFLQTLSLFRDGWTAEAAEAATRSPRTTDILASLVDRSLILSAEIEGEMRFSMLETVRADLRKRLPRRAAEEAAPRFADYYGRIAATYTNPGAGAWERTNHRRLDREAKNFEAVAAMCEEGLVSVDAAAMAAGSLHLHWSYRGQGRVGIALIERILSVPSKEPPGRGHFFAYQALFVLAQEAGDQAKAEMALGSVQALALAQPDIEVRFRALTQMGNSFLQEGRFSDAARFHRQAVEAANEMGSARMSAAAHCNLAESLFGLDRHEEAVAQWARSATLDHQTGNIAGETMLYLGFALCVQGDLTDGVKRLETYLRNVQGLGYSRGVGLALYYLGLPVALLGEDELAKTLVFSARASLRDGRHVLNAFELKCVSKVEARLGADEANGAPVDVEEAIVAACGFLDSRRAAG